MSRLLRQFAVGAALIAAVVVGALVLVAALGALMPVQVPL